MTEARTPRIHPSAQRGLLAALSLPYTVTRAPPFDLRDHLRQIECNYKNDAGKPPTVITRNEQLAHWEHCVDAANGPRDHDLCGWTAGIAGPGAITYPECVAAQLACYYLRRGRVVCWINLTARLGGERDLAQECAPYAPGDLDALILTGLRWDGDRVRFDKAFDLLRATAAHTDRVIVGVGEDPLALTRYLDVSVNRALNVVESRLVQM